MARDALAYGRPNLICLSVVDAEDATAGLTLENDPTLAAADVMLISDEQALTEMAAEHVTFTSGSVKPIPGETISGATSGSTAVVIGCLLSSGTWGAGTAAGTLWVEQASGAFQSENLDNDDTGDTNFATIGGDLVDSAIDAVGRTIGIGVTSSEASCRQGNIEFRDATATEEYLEEYIAFATYGHPDSELPPLDPNVLHSTTINGAPASQTDVDILTGPTDDAGLPAGTMAVITDGSDVRQKTVVRVASYDQSDNKRVQFTDTPGFTIAAGDRIDFYAVTPAIGLDGTNLTEAGGTGDHLTALNVYSISGSTVAADRLEEFAEALIVGTTSGTPTTTTSDTDLTGYADDELIGRTIVFKGGTADGQSARITDYASTNGALTFTTLTTAPAASDAFVII